MDLNKQANLFLYNANVGDYYMVGNTKISVIKRTPKQIHLSNGVIVYIKKTNHDMLYLHSKGVKRNNRIYPIVNQIIRDIEGYLIYKKLTQNYGFN